ncbi:hypothetical protein NECAME_07922 [Necator americanus]|uniref:Uncharacterized protein n=1 Tax=Necator americanus TaxID=51031 RepID=W2TN30_NECAM|nr:hypothetical protein NECAME_07922 [Necator americanus]ETN82536.1 hypothetical protein NECAME_07922 [Necator americanus]
MKAPFAHLREFHTLVVITSPLPQQQTQQAPVRQFFEMDTEKLKDFWHTAMISGLIKAHSKQILRNLPYVEHVVYNLCTHDAKTTVALAKCAVRVFDLRDATQQRIEYERRQPVVSTSNFLERHPLTRVIHGTRSSKWTGVTKFLYRDAKKKRFFHKQKRGNKRKRKRRNVENRRDDDARNDPIGNPKERLRPAMNFGKVVSEYMKKVLQFPNAPDSRFFEKMNLGIDSRTPELANNAIETMEGVLEIVNAFAIIAINKKQQNRLLDIIMDVSGAGKALEGSGYGCGAIADYETLVRIKPEIEEVKYIKLPLVQEISRKHEKWIRARNHFTEEQKMDYEEKGYAFLNEEQLNLIYNRQEQLLHGINVTELTRMTKEQKTKRIERDIRALAALDQPSVPTWGTKHFRKRRATPPSADPELKENEERINGVLFETLQPYAFTAEVLSPHILGGAHSHEEAEHTVSEIGAHSDHIHGDEEHERAEGSHHSHEIEEETVSGLPPWIHIVNGR